MTTNLWWTPRALGMHVVVLIVVPVCVALCDWQVHRALSGNDLSWAYVFEWPFFAAYALYMWWRLVHDQPARAGAGVAEGPPATPTRPEEPADDDLAAYNRYLADLDWSDPPKRW